MTKTNFQESVVLTFKIAATSLVSSSGFWLLNLVAPERIGFMAAYAVFNLWFFGFLNNRFWGFK